MMKYKVLSTKKLEPSLIEQAKQKNIEIIEKEFISIKPILSKENLTRILKLTKSGKRCVAFTSSNAVTAFNNYVHVGDTYYVIDWKIFCLSGKTKEAVLNTGYTENSILSEAENASSLAKKVIEQKIDEVIFVCGDKRRDEFPSTLKGAGIKVHEIVVYETVKIPSITTDKIDGIIFFSPSAVQSFFSINKLNRSTVCFAIGRTTADSIADFADNRIITSESPSQEMMMATVNFYFQNINCYE